LKIGLYEYVLLDSDVDATDVKWLLVKGPDVKPGKTPGTPAASAAAAAAPMQSTTSLGKSASRESQNKPVQHLKAKPFYLCRSHHKLVRPILGSDRTPVPTPAGSILDAKTKVMEKGECRGFFFPSNFKDEKWNPCPSTGKLQILTKAGQGGGIEKIRGDHNQKSR
jgi:hypothetical protein